MPDLESSEKEAYDFLLPILSHSACNRPTKPSVTLTYACSLDALISGKSGQQLLLSGRESLVMTHALRALHDGILVGVGTVVNDNPSLTVRYVAKLSDATPVVRHPTPIILDSKLKTPLDCNLVTRNPIIITSVDSDTKKEGALRDRGAVILPCPSLGNGHLDLATAFTSLYKNHSVRSIMIEGGAGVIRTMLVDHSNLIDQIIVTIAPKFVGQGVHATGLNSLDSTGRRDDLAVNMPELDQVTYKQFGRDIVMAARIMKK